MLTDVFEHPGSSISEITARTGFPQSHVSTAVATLRDLGAMMTEVDPLDRRRTLVAPAAGVQGGAVERGSGGVDTTVADAMANSSPSEVAEVVALDLVAWHLMPGLVTSMRAESPRVDA